MNAMRAQVAAMAAPPAEPPAVPEAQVRNRGQGRPALCNLHVSNALFTFSLCCALQIKMMVMPSLLPAVLSGIQGGLVMAAAGDAAAALSQWTNCGAMLVRCARWLWIPRQAAFAACPTRLAPLLLPSAVDDWRRRVAAQHPAVHGS